MTSSPAYAQQIIQAGRGLGFGGPNDPRKRIAAINWQGAGTPAEATPQPAGVGGEAVATNTTTNPDTQKPMSDVFWNETSIGGALKGMWNAVNLPREVYEGKVDPRSEEGIGRVADMAMNVTGGSSVVPKPANVLTAGADITSLGQTYRHGLGSNKLRVPLEEMSAVRKPTGELGTRTIVSPEELQGSVLVPAIGDRTMAGHTLSEVNGQKLSRDVNLQGGPDFMRGPQQAADGVAWASHPSVISGIDNKIKALGTDKPVNMVYTAMGPRSGDFAHMTTDTLLGMLPNSPIDRAGREAFDQAMRAKYPQFAGIGSEGLRDQLMVPGLKTAGMRKEFVKTMEGKRFQDAGFPDVPSARYATTEPALLNVEDGTSGYAISRMDGGKKIMKPSMPHETYQAQLQGKYLGGLEEGIPRNLMFHDYIKGLEAQGMTNRNHQDYTFSRQNVTQVADQEWLDRIMRHIETQRSAR